MQARTIIDRIKIEPQTGNVGVRMRKQLVADNDKMMSSEYHWTMIDSSPIRLYKWRPRTSI